ncbi:MAG: glutamine--fructose-6-phosphate transaminase (isomerizing) [Halorhodospira halophila]|uniref:glutamine--fructose-6-phosphate transaminase (isomerizing) n=1 Tax=Halorhodospira TaxID=85108 RepID=UPI0019123F47|nr:MULTISPECIES: glutamine--fructose-6-phosphate transaminase (isomerizing) [Halorhodospira]MBK5936308.1 glutamine--fructose-6-phosphate transaminase (isomerizing) [Halorhodospira halophila]MBK5943603.1 glutamine--fructose-6-phosphate transaminase (isomerizing) [Halorhodospira halophila]MCC3750915.1 glutamine--fructose-6-phosphate transaminase (isomerizing) [Halorhodospira halophila]MCG5527134.1 glutamine--fructose-6-phosphate transaminase (isomerizing) [Halorhodospira halophila]MCG5532951.1 g
MCGIVGACAQRDVAPVLLEGLRRLEYRGYDSAGMAVIDPDGRLSRTRVAGRVDDLASALEPRLPAGGTGIAHTRWATHGVPNDINAHPHTAAGEVALVHNGIIENHERLREQLLAAGYEFQSETDTEVAVTLFADRHTRGGVDLLEAVRGGLPELEGAYAFAVVSAREPGRMIACRRGSPLVIGVGIGEHFVASDVAALLPVTRQFIFLEDGDLADLSRDGVTIYDAEGRPVERPVRTSELSAESVERGGYRHFMLKEIHEQPAAVAETLEGRHADGRVLEAAFGPGAEQLLDQAERLQIVACGTSYHAGLIARFWAETYAGLPCDVEVASEFRYRAHAVPPGTLVVVISQSGETADVLAALRESRRLGYGGVMAICNVPESSLVREADLTLLTRAGPEIGVASTKAFTTQLTALLLLVGAFARRRGRPQAEQELVRAAVQLPGALERAVAIEPQVAELAEQFVDRAHALFLGRGAHYPVALEGSLKLKEISYIHAEAYPAGELKHGPLALVDDGMPVVAVAPRDDLLDKLHSNLQEVRARGGRLFVFADDAAALRSARGFHVLPVPAGPEAISPVIHTVPLQLLAYHVAVLRGTDVDKPRNLAKSVTVE